jgi:hypothetical protein
MTVEQIYSLLMTLLILVILVIMWRLFLDYQDVKAQLYRTIIKTGNNQIDSEIDTLDLDALIKHANDRNLPIKPSVPSK